MKTIIHEDGLAVGGTRIEVRVSRRNLLTLLAKLDGHPPDSACTILGPVIWPATTLLAEEDDVHYNDAARVEAVGDNQPGQMHPDTEAISDAVDPLEALGYVLVHSDAGAKHYEKKVEVGS